LGHSNPSSHRSYIHYFVWRMFNILLLGYLMDGEFQYSSVICYIGVHILCIHHRSTTTMTKDVVHMMCTLDDIYCSEDSDSQLYLSPLPLIQLRFFKLLDEKEFMRTANPKFFKHSAIRSFYRQLQLWGFER